MERNLLRRVTNTSLRKTLTGYQTHLNKEAYLPANSNGVWNLVLANAAVNNAKSARAPELRYL